MQSEGSGGPGPPSAKAGGRGRGGSSRPYYHRPYHRRNNDRSKKGETHGDTQRDVLIRRFKQRQCDCMICCERIHRQQGVWSCQVCFNVFHLKCIRSWALKDTGQSESSGVWRCPACQSPTTVIPEEYRCFCGKVVNPSTPPHNECPHTCGQPCHRPCKTARSTDKNFEGHPCGMLCHPGPCGPCSAFINRSCKCGRLSVPSQCSAQSGELDCGEACHKTLSCGKHKCNETCHSPPCSQCSITIPVACFCGKTIRSFSCDDYKEGGDNEFSCSEICGRLLSCGNHNCSQKCHSGDCPPCQRQPEVVKTCPCGRMSLADHDPPFEERPSCIDPIPTCESLCKKSLSCGDGFDHFCQLQCHDSDCPPCSQFVGVRCRCGRLTERYVCSERPRPLTCVFRCNKKMSCRKHKCTNLCCTMGADDQNSHICAQPCNRLLVCGQHRCVQLCGHLGDCPPCYNASFDELACYCGNTILYPPVPCGAKPPPCEKPCSREQACSHPPSHKCHSDTPCPPCMEPVQCTCIGRHVKMTVPCSTPVENISCGRMCDRLLECGHRCAKVCHLGPCSESKCREQCQLPRQSGCGHPCAQSCHEPKPCPDPATTPCRYEVEFKCRCGLRLAKQQCPGSAEALQALHLSCDERCALAERNRRLAEALQLTDVPLLPKAPITVYPAFVQEAVQRAPAFALDVEYAIAELVKGLGSSPPGTRKAHSFKAMSSNFRRFIHEMVPFYGCEAQSYDAEPNRNVIVYATCGKCFLPATSLQQSYPTAFLGVSGNAARSTSPSVMRSTRGSGAAQLPPSYRANTAMQFEKLPADAWRYGDEKNNRNNSTLASTSAENNVSASVPSAAQVLAVQKQKRGKKQVVSCFDETVDHFGDETNTAAASAPAKNTTEQPVATLMTGSGPVKFSLPSSKNSNNTAVPDHWDDN